MKQEIDNYRVTRNRLIEKDVIESNPYQTLQIYVHVYQLSQELQTVLLHIVHYLPELFMVLKQTLAMHEVIYTACSRILTYMTY